VASCTVAQLYGKDMDKWDEAKWALCTKSNRVLVDTAEIFRQALVDRGFLNVEQISLCIFDECHHAVGNAPMMMMMMILMKEYHHCSFRNKI
jgi:endoribonuclease Dicer